MSSIQKMESLCTSIVSGALKMIDAKDGDSLRQVCGNQFGENFECLLQQTKTCFFIHIYLLTIK
jgi:hypothetical protein